VLLAGDALSLINPFTGEGIFYAVLSGSLAGAAAVSAEPAARYTRELGRRLGAHLRQSRLAARLTGWPRVVDAAVRAGHDPVVFGHLADLGLGDGTLPLRTWCRIVGEVLRPSPVTGP
jgi:flavin-dependent dehydrogenase